MKPRLLPLLTLAPLLTGCPDDVTGDAGTGIIDDTTTSDTGGTPTTMTPTTVAADSTSGGGSMGEEGPADSTGSTSTNPDSSTDAGEESTAGTTGDPTGGTTSDPTGGTTSDPTGGTTGDPTTSGTTGDPTTGGTTGDPTTSGTTGDPTTSGTTGDPTGGSTGGSTGDNCGDGVIDPGEHCEAAMAGPLSCADVGLAGGMIGCDNCIYDLTMCTDPGNVFGQDSGYVGYNAMPGMLACADISGTGTATGMTDDEHTTADLGFTFSMYGTDFTEVRIGSNGTIYFGGDDYLGLANVCMPDVTVYTPQDNIVGVFWDDLNPGLAGEVYFETSGAVGSEVFTVQWDVPHFDGDAMDLMQFQVTLQPNGLITSCYVDTLSAGNEGDNGAEATAGIQADPTEGFDFSCNAPNLVDGTQLIYVPL